MNRLRALEEIKDDLVSYSGMKYKEYVKVDLAVDKYFWIDLNEKAWKIYHEERAIYLLTNVCTTSIDSKEQALQVIKDINKECWII